MTFDTVIRGGTVVDGTGAPARAADVGIRDGVVAEVGAALDRGREELDATGCIVTPGFVDPHTHLDAQLCWDAAASPSTLHGVTSVVLGIRGFGIAPCHDGDGEYLLRSLEAVEEIPYASASLGVGFEWTTWGEFMQHLTGRELGVNAAGMVPHSALRYFVMGERAGSQPASEDERDAMAGELRRAIADGALGFATSRGPNHTDGNGDPVPSRAADDDEPRALVQECRGRVWQINVATKFATNIIKTIPAVFGSNIPAGALGRSLARSLGRRGARSEVGVAMAVSSILIATAIMCTMPTIRSITAIR